MKRAMWAGAGRTVAGLALGIMLGVGVDVGVGVGGAQAADAVRVGSKLDAESGLLGTMILQVLEANGIPTENKIQLGPTKIVRSALLAGEIDVYPEYTGNGAFFFFYSPNECKECACGPVHPHSATVH